MISNHILRRSHRWGSVIKNGVLRSFAKFAGKHLCQSFFCNKVAGQACNSIKKDRLWHSYFPVNFAKFLRTPFLQNISSGCFCILWSNSRKLLKLPEPIYKIGHSFLMHALFIEKLTSFENFWVKKF